MAEPRLRFDKAKFFEDLGYHPHPGQLEIHLDEHPRRVVACGVRWGKTLCAAMEGLAAAMQPCERSVGWVAAPTYDLANKVFREIVFIAQKHLHHHIIKLSASNGLLVLRNMSGGISEIRAKSADNPVSLLGEGLDWLIVDEASRLKPDIWQSHLSKAAGIPIDVLPINYHVDHEVIVEGVYAPTESREGQTVALRAVLRATGPAQGHTFPQTRRSARRPRQWPGQGDTRRASSMTLEEGLEGSSATDPPRLPQPRTPRMPRIPQRLFISCPVFWPR